MPIGSIIDYVGPIESSSGEAAKQLRGGYMVWAKGHTNWVVCNGATLSEDKFSEFLKKFDKNPAPGFQLPDLKGRFTKGTSIEDVGNSGGVKNHELNLSHTHRINPCGGATGSNQLLAKGWLGGLTNCNERAKNQTEGSLQVFSIDNEPPFYGVLKIMRIK